MKPIKASLPSYIYNSIPGFLLIACISQAQTVNEQAGAVVKNDLEQQVADYASRLGSHNYRIEIIPLPPLKLPLCQHQPEVSTIGQPTRLTGRLTRKVTCSTPHWSLNIRAQVDIFLPVVKSRHNIDRNSTIRADDLILEEENIAKLRGNYFSSIKDVAGQRSRRQITGNSILQPSMTERPALVSRNASVVIHAGHAGFSITMKGQALESGSLGDQVQVRNSSSGKIIMSEVTGQGTVKIID
ncbi:flagellar basal body P-ring formation protein FlgA [Sansalvadorimonas sp. 2012CJ34-2]|uniref:Flagella basal body P-ring formation protein FlgA n=1 Tax=Parendozoicomonas callyspongiae TaxID=2942213 RepID=A0ABT0PKD2_9GAMM|nr:flagellar basal body P-ring formation chaperone FlgA [Sansalvadorimonas sp. 2012CJ34-2]MCL6271793.1 flagellar basal body P-ring formation protein FlgA [Sansalvadorimonas sp. 2012CJ34-2]